MNRILPEGLISISSTESEPVPSDPADLRYLNLRALHNFWKVYATQSRLSRTAADERSRNLFWRVWSNPHLSQKLPPQTVQELWAACDRAFDLTSFTLSLPGRETDHYGKADNAKDFTEQQCIQPEAGHSSPDGVRRGHDPTSRRSEPNLRSPPHRFLSDESVGTTESAQTSGRPRQSSFEVPEDHILQPAHVSKPALNRSGSGGKRGSVVAGGARVRHRPSLSRRKSSQTNVNKTTDSPKSPRPILKSPLKSPLRMSEMAGDGPRPHGYPFPTATNETSFVLPSASSWQDVDEKAGAHISGSSSMGATEMLVDRDFRGKFAERIASSSSLAIVNKMKKTGSVVRFADEVPAELHRGKQRKQSSSSEESDHGLRKPLARHDSTTSQALDDSSDDDDVVELPRTRSQLSLAIHNMRKDSNGPDVVRPNPSASTKAPASKAEEEKLLDMGRKDGVTKAGGVQVRQPHRLTGQSVQRHESPSPPPLF